MNLSSPVWKRYLAAIGWVAAGIALRILLREILGLSLTYLTFFPAVVFSAIYCGLGGGLLSVALSVAAVVFLSKPPFYRAGGAASSDAVVAVTFIVLALCICFIGEALRRSRAANESRLRDLGLEIARRRDAEQTLRHQWKSFDVALSNSPDFTYTFDLEGRFTYANQPLVQVLQRPLSDVLGKTFFQLDFPPELAIRLQRQIQQVIVTRQLVKDQLPYTAPDGKTRQYEYIFTPVIGANGHVEAVAGSTRDTTERTQTEEALRKSEERLKLALEAGSGAGVWDWNIATGKIYYGAQFARLYASNRDSASEGISFEEFLDHVHPDDRERVRDGMQQAVNGAGEFIEEYRAVQRDGSLHWLSARGRCHVNESGKCIRFPGVVFDITANKRVEESLRDSQERLQAIYHGTYEYIGLLTPEGIVLEANRASLEFADLRRDEVVGRPFWDCAWFTYTPGAADLIKDALLRSAAGEFVRLEVALHRPSGELVTFDVSLHPIRNAEGDVIFIVPEGRNITERKRAEEDLQRSNEQLTRANRELEEFGFVASHDLQEPLRMVNIYTQLILRDIPVSTPQVSQYAAFVNQGVDRMETLIRDLLSFSQTGHHDDLSVGVADLSAALKEAVSVLEGRIRESGAVIDVAPLPLVLGNTLQFAHVFQNLLSNAIKYRRAEEPPRIQISAAQDHDHWTVTIRDNGIGFDPRYADRIFGLFKRLHKAEYPGTGLGLAICRRIVERYGGHIWAESEIGQGAAFHLALAPAPASEPFTEVA